MIKRDKLYPAQTFDGGEPIYDSLTHEFREDGTVLLSDRHGNELSFSLASLVAYDNLVLSETQDTIVYRLTHQTGLGANDSDVSIEFDFASHPDRVKIRIHGTIPTARTLRIPVTSPSADKASDAAVNNTKRVQAAKYDPLGEIESAVALDFSDTEGRFSKGALLIDVEDHFDIDPSTVGTTTSAHPTTNFSQRKVVVAAGRQWAFYSDGTNMVYRSRIITPLSAWSAATTVRASGVGYSASVWYDGLRIHIVTAGTAGGDAFLYRYGVPTAGGEIMWLPARTVRAGVAGKMMSYGNVCTDSARYPIAAYSRQDAAGRYCVYIRKATNIEGSAWDAEVELASSPDGPCIQTIVLPLKDRKLLVIYAAYRGAAYQLESRFWDGAAWGAITVIGSVISYGYYSAVVLGSSTVLIAHRVGVQSYYAIWTEDSWTAPALIGDFYDGVLTKTNYFACFIYQRDGEVKYREYKGAWGDEATFAAENGSAVTAAYQHTDGSIDAIYRFGGASPYDVRHRSIVITPVAQTEEPHTARDACRLNGNVLDDDGEIVDYTGFVWDTDSQSDPGNVHPSATDYANHWVSDEGDYGTGAFSHVMTPVPYTQYYFRAAVHLRNPDVWIYGEERLFFADKRRVLLGTHYGAGGTAIYPSVNPSAIYFEGANYRRTFVAWQSFGPLSIGSGPPPGVHPFLSYYDHDTKTWHGPWQIGVSGISGDQHSGCAIAIDANNRLHAFFGAHALQAGDTRLQWTRSTRDIDTAAPFTGVGDFEAQKFISGDEATYPQVIIDADGVLWVTIRQHVGAVIVMSYAISNDYAGPWAVASFGAWTRITGDFGADYVYPRTMPFLDHLGNIHFTFTKYNVAAVELRNVFYVQWNRANARFEKPDGTHLVLPFDEVDAELVAAGHMVALADAVAADEHGRIFCVWLDYTTSTVWFRRWNGIAWDAAINLGIGVYHHLKLLRHLHIFCTTGGIQEFISEDHGVSFSGPFQRTGAISGGLSLPQNFPGRGAVVARHVENNNGTWTRRGFLTSWGMDSRVQRSQAGVWTGHALHYWDGAAWRQAGAVRVWNATTGMWDIM